MVSELLIRTSIPSLSVNNRLTGHCSLMTQLHETVLTNLKSYKFKLVDKTTQLKFMIYLVRMSRMSASYNIGKTAKCDKNSLIKEL